ncbi:MAG: S1C family serine protease [Patescibacteria group bacterium]|nr:S1C family serine protease [Patescibacteria group bacterium]
MVKNVFKILGIFILGIGGGIFADQILWPYFVERPLFYQYGLEKTPVCVTERKEIIIQENTTLESAVEKVEKAVVGMKTKTKAGKILEGSGLIVTSDGLVVTLAELVPQGSDFSFYLNDKIASYQILKRDLKNNLALIKLEEKNLPTIGFADFEKIKLGERVFLVGIVFEKAKPQKIVNEGIVKSFNEDFIKTNIFEKYYLSGSPLFNIEGEVLGLNNIDSEGEVITIPIDKIKKFLGF